MPKRKKKVNETQKVKKEPGAHKTTTRLSRRANAITEPLQMTRKSDKDRQTTVTTGGVAMNYNYKTIRRSKERTRHGRNTRKKQKE